MENYNNRIITLSGDPVSGKGTIAQKLVELYEKQGFKVHLISIGDFFRRASIKEYKKKFPEIENPSIEKLQKDPNFAEELKNIDEKIDLEIIPEVGADINSKERPNEVFIIDSRTATFFIGQPHFAVRTTVDQETAGERVFNDIKRGPEDQYSSQEAATVATLNRREEEIKRYKDRYGKDITDPNNFDLVIGTTLASIEDIASTIVTCEKLNREGKPYAKYWASPELFFPTQPIGDTFSNGMFTAGFTPEEIADSIKENGIYPDEPIYSKTVTGTPYQFVSNGHHRVVASIMAGKTLIPYEPRGNLDKLAVYSEAAISEIYNYEDAIHRPNGEAFRYKKYPEIDEKVTDLDRD